MRQLVCIHNGHFCTIQLMSLPYTNDDVQRAHRMNVRFYNMRNRLRWYLRNLTESTKNAAKLMCASVAACIHGVFPKTFKYTALAVCLSIVENDLMHSKIPMHAPIPDSSTDHSHDV
jgi:hypothetical protein